MVSNILVSNDLSVRAEVYNFKWPCKITGQQNKREGIATSHHHTPPPAPRNDMILS